MGGSGISWDICKSAPDPRHNHASIPALSFHRPNRPYPSCGPTNSIRALKERMLKSEKETENLRHDIKAKFEKEIEADYDTVKANLRTRN